MNKFWCYFHFSLLMLFSCTKIEKGQFPIEHDAPGQVTNVKVANVAGGANISYTIPTDNDLLYVKVIYKLDDGRIMEQKASAYANSLKVEGIGKSFEQEVELICGDRSKN